MREQSRQQHTTYHYQDSTQLASRDGFERVMPQNIDAEKAKQWIANGAQPTDTVRVLLKKSNIL